MNHLTFTEKDHTWLVCAYKESPYLEECIQSVLNQTVKSRIQIATSTPCDYISAVAKKYGLPVYINTGKAGICGDWNFALSTGETELLTIAHQDDIYEPGYTGEMLRRINRAENPILYFTNYGELRNGEKITADRLLKVKRMLMVPTRAFPGLKTARRASLAFGNAICCPSVTYLKSVIGNEPFGDRFKSNLDWELSEKLSKEKGQFVYCPEIQMYHRIHGESTTTEIIGDNLRTIEDYEMMRKFWPEWIAKRLNRKYAAAEKSNQV